MKKTANTAFAYAIAALTAGFLYRIYTEGMHFEGTTRLSVLHTHLFTLGMFFFLVVLVLERLFPLGEAKIYKPFYWVYNLGVIVTTLALMARGIADVAIGKNLSSGMDKSIAGVAGIGHILLSVGLVFFFVALGKAMDGNKK